MPVDVVVPSYQRAELLGRCLEALLNQVRAPERVIVVCRIDDMATASVLADWTSRLSSLTPVQVSSAGLIAALSAGVAASSSPIIAFTDDDASPGPNWIGSLVERFTDSTIGGVGGRDVIPGEEGPLCSEVGITKPSGRVIGNHHLGTGDARDVDLLKGVNMAFRTEALALPRSGVLRGTGAQAHSEPLVCGWARRRGWRLVYDPEIQVKHEAAQRPKADHRGRPSQSAALNAAYNTTLGLGLISDSWRARPVIYSLLAGSRAEPGLGRALAGLLQAEWEVVRRFPASAVGHAMGLLNALRGPSLDEVMITATELRRIGLLPNDSGLQLG